jgi:hypothetical protein
MSYVVGKRALAICDRCGQQFKLLALKTEWQGLKTCSECWEKKHPQLGPFKVPPEPQALYKPRPEAAMGLTVPVGENEVFPPWQNGSLHAQVILGTVEVAT